MSYDEFEKYYYELSDKANQAFGGESQHFKDHLESLKNHASDNVSFEIVYAVALYESLQYQQDMIFLNLGKRFFTNED